MNDSLDGCEPSRIWIRSSYSNGAGGECVECAHVGDIVLVRDTKLGDDRVANVGAHAWRVFARAAGDGWPKRP